MNDQKKYEDHAKEFIKRHRISFLRLILFRVSFYVLVASLAVGFIIGDIIASLIIFVLSLVFYIWVNTCHGFKSCPQANELLCLIMIALSAFSDVFIIFKFGGDILLELALMIPINMFFLHIYNKNKPMYVNIFLRLTNKELYAYMLKVMEECKDLDILKIIDDSEILKRGGNSHETNNY